MDNFSPPPLPSVRPALWNPNAAANWSILLTPIFGSYLHHRNWLAMGQSGKAAASLKWCIVLSCLLVAYWAFPFEKMPFPELMKRVQVILLLVWYFVSAKQQVRFVKEHHPGGYEKKKWGMTLLKGLGGIVALMAVAIIVGLVMEALGVWEPVE